jgi:hypothetical protein
MAHFWSGQFLQSAVKIAYLLKLVRPIQLEQYDRICDTWQSKSLRKNSTRFTFSSGSAMRTRCGVASTRAGLPSIRTLAGADDVDGAHALITAAGRRWELNQRSRIRRSLVVFS